ncbi:MAG TPA: PAS domain S-box protein [Phycisphaerae bacterium]|nr:PAS domain S-box protein [Phycisphaerae bacterium]
MDLATPHFTDTSAPRAIAIAATICVLLALPPAQVAARAQTGAIATGESAPSVPGPAPLVFGFDMGPGRAIAGAVAILTLLAWIAHRAMDRRRRRPSAQPTTIAGTGDDNHPRDEFTEPLFQAAFDAAPAGMLIVDRTGQIQVMNRRFETMFGYARDELRNQPIEMLVPPEIRERHVGLRSDYLSAPSPRYMAQGRDLFGVRRNGTEFPVEIGLNPIRYRNDDAVLCVVLDRTERQRVEQQTRGFNTLIESSHDAIIGKDLNGRITSWNRGAEVIYGYSAAEALGKHIEIILADDRASELRSILGRVSRGEHVVHFETRRRRKDGRAVAVDLSISPVHDSVGRIVGAMSIARDITERNRIGAELEQCAEALRSSNFAMQRFAHVALDNHESGRTPQTSVSHLLTRMFGDNVGEATKAEIDGILERTEELANLVDKVLAYSRADNLSLRRETVDAQEIVSDVIRALAPPPLIDVRIDEALPVVQYDPLQFRQIFENLLSNAILHLGKPSGEVVVSCQRRNQMHQFTIRDNGVGIPQSQLDRLFNHAIPAESTDNQDSRGLGMAIVVRIVERHGGRVQVLSRAGAGAEVNFTVPIVDAALAPPRQSQPGKVIPSDG